MPRNPERKIELYVTQKRLATIHEGVVRAMKSEGLHNLPNKKFQLFGRHLMKPRNSVMLTKSKTKKYLGVIKAHKATLYYKYRKVPAIKYVITINSKIGNYAYERNKSTALDVVGYDRKHVNMWRIKEFWKRVVNDQIERTLFHEYGHYYFSMFISETRRFIREYSRSGEPEAEKASTTLRACVNGFIDTFDADEEKICDYFAFYMQGKRKEPFMNVKQKDAIAFFVKCLREFKI